MISPEYVRTLADYNRWQNESLYGAAAGLPEEERRRQRGAFFGSIHATLNHVLWADQIWMSRLVGSTPPPAPNIAASTTQFERWEDLERERRAYDEVIVRWAEGVTAGSLEGELSWFSKAMGRDLTHPRWLLVTHMFNHQTHHRGQVHCMLTAAGRKPDDTDLPFKPSRPRR
ncbi:MAG: damage-inducible protein DinB [Myxococcales bacterium]|nr:MAG: damage-inducible protein DinB [Myxococcales bacterium]